MVLNCPLFFAFSSQFTLLSQRKFHRLEVARAAKRARQENESALVEGQSTSSPSPTLSEQFESTSPPSPTLSGQFEDMPIEQEPEDGRFPVLDIDADHLEDAIDEEELNSLLVFDDGYTSDRFNGIRILLKTFKFTCKQGDAMLQLLRKQYPNDNYPPSWRALFNTPRISIQTRPIGNGNYFHFGIQNGLKAYHPSVFKDMFEFIVDFGCDGFQISGSSTKCGWPILGSIVGTRLKPYLVGMYDGLGQPNDTELYLKDFCEEVDQLQKTGIELPNGRLVSFKIRVFTCDLPARIKLSGVVGYLSKKGCGKCDQESYHEGHVNYFQPTVGTLRTNESHEQRVDPEYHKSVTPTALERVGIPMVDAFPIDCMHLVDLGVARTVLSAIVRKKCIGGGAIDVDEMSATYTTYKKLTPKEFARVPRDLKSHAKFKATELRQFLLYGGVVLLKQHLSPDAYEHFLQLSLGYRIVNDKMFRNSLDTAQRLFENFVMDYKHFFPEGGLPHNVHGLLHIVADCKRLGPVQGFSAYKYENCIQLLGRQIRKPSQVLQQLYNRIRENQFANMLESTASDFEWIIRKGDVFIMKNSLKYVKVSDINGENISAQEFLTTVNFFTRPIESKALFIVLTDSVDGDLLGSPERVKKSEFLAKCYAIPYYDDFVLLPLVDN